MIAQALNVPEMVDTDVSRKLRERNSRYLADEPMREAQHADWKRAAEVEDRPRKQKQEAIEAGLDLMFRLNNEQRAQADQAMQAQRFAWDEEDRKAQIEEAQRRGADLDAKREVNRQTNTALIVARQQAAAKVGRQLNPQTLEAMTTAAELMDPNQFRLFFNEVADLELRGGDMTDLNADVIKAFGQVIESRAQADQMAAEDRLKEIDGSIAQLKEREAAGASNLTAVRSALRERQVIRQMREQELGLIQRRNNLRWRAGLPRNINEFSTTYGTNHIGQFVQLAIEEWTLQNGGEPMPEHDPLIAERARQMAESVGWQVR